MSWLKWTNHWAIFLDNILLKTHSHNLLHIPSLLSIAVPTLCESTSGPAAVPQQDTVRTAAGKGQHKLLMNVLNLVCGLCKGCCLPYINCWNLNVTDCKANACPLVYIHPEDGQHFHHFQCELSSLTQCEANTLDCRDSFHGHIEAICDCKVNGRLFPHIHRNKQRFHNF